MTYSLSIMFKNYTCSSRLLSVMKKETQHNIFLTEALAICVNYKQVLWWNESMLGNSRPTPGMTAQAAEVSAAHKPNCNET